MFLRLCLLAVTGLVAMQIVGAMMTVPSTDDIGEMFAVASGGPAKAYDLPGTIKCIGVDAIKKVFGEATDVCVPLGDGFLYRACAVRKMSRLLPRLVYCMHKNKV